MNSIDRLRANQDRGGTLDGKLWGFSIVIAREEIGALSSYTNMTEEDVRKWLAWDEKLLNDEEFREKYAALMALVDL